MVIFQTSHILESISIINPFMLLLLFQTSV